VDEMIDDGAIDDRDRELILATGARASIVVPLRARGSVRGALALGFATLERRDAEELVALFEELGRRAGVALDAARLHDERTAVAHTLQRMLLPPVLPEVPGMDIAARYRAAGAGDDVGGDFYDCFPTAPNEWAAVIGDVSGRGAEAAALTALARHTIRAAVVHDPQPEAVLRALNDAILRHETDYRFCTVLYVRLVPADGGIDACIATGGHPLPLLVRACGTVEAVGRPGTLLGVVGDPENGETTVRRAPGDALVLFTDGVIEASPHDGSLAPERLADYLAGCAGRDAGRIAAGVEGRVLEHHQGRPRDDVAVVVLKVAQGGPAPFVASGEGVAAAT
jgi:serine phosphatase RsbU (regulator of sigma subunit)